MKRKKMRITGVLVVSLILLTSIMVFSEAGSENDPLVSQSYVNMKIEDLKKYIDEKVGTGGGNTVAGNKLEVVELRKGQYLIGSAGTEIIIRGGKALAHGVKQDGGITDVTAGKDIDSTKTLLPYNHLLIVPRNDGRGAYVTEDAVFMVRGSYEIR